jgi:hypothetical protein
MLFAKPNWKEALGRKENYTILEFKQTGRECLDFVHLAKDLAVLKIWVL